ncbi:MAG: inositol monophosphatase [Lentimicrobiaceae bacterium]|jgi:3'(2'), 5'-bisphosphate nucleotidase/myo-inositol-1(or 4)-monophosphatase|nr:inositol monophosphatase [Lentimicrobiaceae bacterium]
MIKDLIKIVVKTGKAISQRRHINAQGGVWSNGELKTEADKYAHSLLVEYLNKLEDIPVISEEDIASHTLHRPDCYWIIDPIDGTRSLVDGFPGWVTQVALVEYGQTVSAVIYAPDLDLLYVAELGKGAYLNGIKLEIKHNSNSGTTLIDNYPDPRGIAADIMRLVPCSDYVESGSLSLKICRVADGVADLFVKDVEIRDWDVAAPMLILFEAGGVISQVDGAQFDLYGDFEKNGLIVAKSEKLKNKVIGFGLRL